MKYAFCFLDSEERKDPGKYGYNYAKTKESEWVTCGDDVDTYFCGAVKGVDFVYYNEKAYSIHKKYLDISTNTLVAICLESPSSCDVRTAF